MYWKKKSKDPARSWKFSVERSRRTTVLSLHEWESLAGADLGSLDGLWDFFAEEKRKPSRVIVFVAPPCLLRPRSLARLLGDPDAGSDVPSVEVSKRILREENVNQRFIENVRGLDSFVVGVADGEVALRLAAPLLACDYRIVSSGTVLVNTTQKYPRAPLNCLPWLLAEMVGGARASQLLLDVPRMSADDAYALGLVNHIAAVDRLKEEALEIADRIGSLPRATIVSLKRAMIATSVGFESYRQKELALTQKIASSHWEEEQGGSHENRHSNC